MSFRLYIFLSILPNSLVNQVFLEWSYSPRQQRHAVAMCLLDVRGTKTRIFFFKSTFSLQNFRFTGKLQRHYTEFSFASLSCPYCLTPFTSTVHLLKLRNEHWHIPISPVPLGMSSFWFRLQSKTRHCTSVSGPQGPSLWQFLCLALFFMTLTVLGSAGQLFCGISLCWGLSDDSIGVIGFWKESQGSEMSFSSHIWGWTRHPHDIVGDVNLYHLAKMVLPGFSTL